MIFVLNHPNSLMDPMLLMLGLQHPVTFLAKSTLFVYPLVRRCLEAFGALPVYRPRDAGLPGGPRDGNVAADNEATFARSVALLQQGGRMALFPEGLSHSGTQLMPLRTGAARIALRAEQTSDWTLGVRIVPVGLWYQNKTRFRSSVLLVVGQSFDLAAYASMYATDAPQAVRLLTNRIDTGLKQVVLQTTRPALLAAIPVVATWIAPSSSALALPQQYKWSRRLLATYAWLRRTDPRRLAMLIRQARRYARALHRLGIRQPWTLEAPLANRQRPLWLLMKLACTWPLALAGLCVSYGPYRLAGPIAAYAVGPHATMASTLKLLVGSLLVLLGWLGAAAGCGVWVGGFWGVLVLVTAPLLGYSALLWREWWHEVKDLAASQWLRLHQGAQVQSLIVQRQRLATQVMDAVRHVPHDTAA